jgi:hypothetical protein
MQLIVSYGAPCCCRPDVCGSENSERIHHTRLWPALALAAVVTVIFMWIEPHQVLAARLVDRLYRMFGLHSANRNSMEIWHPSAGQEIPLILKNVSWSGVHKLEAPDNIIFSSPFSDVLHLRFNHTVVWTSLQTNLMVCLILRIFFNYAHLQIISF